MGMMDKLKGMLGGHSEKATDMASGAKDRAMDAGQEASDKAQEHLPGPAADALGNITNRGQQGVDDGQQAASDMESEGGPEWER
ncbi:hypothetical protein [Kitasatospora sp. GAS204B]|uniref:hypothetical protein n=1 Tax=unclassified Kitasatospora TaxID=2633591 RepID=UPI0024730074|nr:hypothetical protein [Kitasatospora sp. GAS204B]MDH6120720.1 hypothetical protein [Kitasatospora sp. GAS204B]